MKLLEEFGPTTNRMVRLFRRLRPGWLIRQNIGIVKGLEQVTDEHIMAVTKVSKRKRLVIDEAKLLSSIHVPIYLDEVWDGPDGWFSLFAGSRRIGLGVRVTDSSGHPRMRWVRLRDLSRFSSAMQRELMEAARRYAIPTEKYGYYNIGRRS
ncbi:MAG TPA: hypothetical protein VNH18_21600 [Bryobacteraceae bacterium]|nr:hypothetical protein [Bryobacteraceae bacterium]